MAGRSGPRSRTMDRRQARTAWRSTRQCSSTATVVADGRKALSRAGVPSPDDHVATQVESRQIPTREHGARSDRVEVDLSRPPGLDGEGVVRRREPRDVDADPISSPPCLDAEPNRAITGGYRGGG